MLEANEDNFFIIKTKVDVFEVTLAPVSESLEARWEAWGSPVLASSTWAELHHSNSYLSRIPAIDAKLLEFQPIFAHCFLLTHV